MSPAVHRLVRLLLSMRPHSGCAANSTRCSWRWACCRRHSGRDRCNPSQAPLECSSVDLSAGHRHPVRGCLSSSTLESAPVIAIRQIVLKAWRDVTANSVHSGGVSGKPGSSRVCPRLQAVEFQGCAVRRSSRSLLTRQHSLARREGGFLMRWYVRTSGDGSRATSVRKGIAGP